jgi:hypothetical protein
MARLTPHKATSKIEAHFAFPRFPQISAGNRRHLQEEANLGRVIIGMVPPQVEQAWGRPVEINSDRDSTGTIERWIYRRADETTTLHFQDGKVSKVTTVKSLGPSLTAVAPEAVE